MLRVLDRLGPRFAWRASGGASDFAHCSESRQSHKAVSSSCRGRFHARSSTDYPFTSSCSPRPDRQDAVSFRCLAGSTARKGLAPFGVCAFPSARARVSSPAACVQASAGRTSPTPQSFHGAAGEDTRAPGRRQWLRLGFVKPRGQEVESAGDKPAGAVACAHASVTLVARRHDVAGSLGSGRDGGLLWHQPSHGLVRHACRLSHRSRWGGDGFGARGKFSHG